MPGTSPGRTPQVSQNSAFEWQRVHEPRQESHELLNGLKLAWRETCNDANNLLVKEPAILAVRGIFMLSVVERRVQNVIGALRRSTRDQNQLTSG